MPTQQTVVAIRSSPDESSTNSASPGALLASAKRKAKAGMPGTTQTAPGAAVPEAVDAAAAATNPANGKKTKFCSICGFGYTNREELWDHIAGCNYLAE